jgi:hypothetical protein
MSAIDSDNEWKDGPARPVMEFDPEVPYPNSVEVFADNWLNDRFARLDRHVIPPTAPSMDMDCVFYERPHDHPDGPARYAVFYWLGRGQVGGIVVTKNDPVDPQQITYMMRGGTWMDNPRDINVPGFRTGRWDRIANENFNRASVNVLPDNEQLRVYPWPGDLITIHGIEAGGTQAMHTQYQVLSTHSAIDCLLRYQNSEVTRNSCAEPEDARSLFLWAGLGKLQ